MGFIGRLRLSSAVKSGNVDRVVVLLDSGVEPDEKSSHQVTALMLAASSDQPEVINVLLDRGASINALDSQGRTALIHAVQGCCAAAARALLDREADANVETAAGVTAHDIARDTEQVGLLKLLMAARASRGR